MRLVILPLISMCSILPAACDLGSVPAVQTAGFEEAVQSIASNRSYLERSFIRINRDPYPTKLSATDLIDVYISQDSAAGYWQIEPDSKDAAAPLPESTVIVRVVMDPDWTPKKLTFMIKEAPGSFPASGDYYYAVTALDGSIAFDDAGQPQAGALPECASCHIERASSDFLFGVPAEQRGKTPSGATMPVRVTTVHDDIHTHTGM